MTRKEKKAARKDRQEKRFSQLKELLERRRQDRIKNKKWHSIFEISDDIYNFFEVSKNNNPQLTSELEEDQRVFLEENAEGLIDSEALPFSNPELAKLLYTVPIGLGPDQFRSARKLFYRHAKMPPSVVEEFIQTLSKQNLTPEQQEDFARRAPGSLDEQEKVLFVGSMLFSYCLLLMSSAQAYELNKKEPDVQ